MELRVNAVRPPHTLLRLDNHISLLYWVTLATRTSILIRSGEGLNQYRSRFIEFEGRRSRWWGCTSARDAQVECPSCTCYFMAWINSPVADSLDSLIMKVDESEQVVWKHVPYDAHMTTVSTAIGVVLLSVVAAVVI